MKERLWLHRELQKTLWSKADEIVSVYRHDDPAHPAHWIAASAASLDFATVFDCRKLPDGLVLDTGQGFVVEPEQIRGPIRLPFDVIYFEFPDDYAVIAQTGKWWGEHSRLGKAEEGYEDSIIYIAFHKPSKFDRLYAADDYDASDMMLSVGVFNNLKPSDKGFMGTVEGEQRFAVYGGVMVAGALSLMKEHLAVSTFVPDPSPRLTLARKKRDKPPLSGDSHVVTLNVPAIHRAVGSSKPQGHESPCLHWRRGHWRVLHRGSEFEKNTWVNKCLVGDPDKGFMRNTYLLRHQLPMLSNDNMRPPPEPLGAT